MTRYHVSRNGEPGVCRAQDEEGCPLGGKTDHIETDNIDEAREFTEKKLAEEYASFPQNITPKKTPQDTPRQTILNAIPQPRIIQNVSELTEHEKKTINARAKKDYDEQIRASRDDKERRAIQLAYDATPAGISTLQNEFREEQSVSRRKKVLEELSSRLELAEKNREVIASYYLRNE